MEESPDAKGYLIDGFPRNTEQGPKFEEKVYSNDVDSSRSKAKNGDNFSFFFFLKGSSL